MEQQNEKIGGTEKTFIMIKPDGVKRGLVGKVIKRFEEKGMELLAIKSLVPSKNILENHYAHLSGRKFFPGIIEYMRSGIVVAMIFRGRDCVKLARRLIGETCPADALPGTIRGDYAMCTGRNIIHGSDSVENANKEISMWFNEFVEPEVREDENIFEPRD